MAIRLIVTVCVITGAFAWQGTASAEPVNRRILAVYDSRFEAKPDLTLIHSKAEMPLNHLGYVLDYSDAATRLPEPEVAAAYAAVVTWFGQDVPRPGEYLSWARRVAESGVPFIIMGGVGAPATPTYLDSINRLLRPLGIAYSGNFVEAANGTSIVWSDPDAIGFEHKVEAVPPAYPVIRRMLADAPVLLEVEAPEREHRVHSMLVTAGPRGALLSPGIALYSDAPSGRTQWIIDPFVIFRRVLGGARTPIPDTTTLSGRRIYYSLLDGDGWNDDVAIERYKPQSAIAAEVAAKEFVEPYPDLPVSVSLVAADVDPRFADADRAVRAASRLFAYKQVEAASHTATSPQVWSYFETYDRAAEEALIGASEPANGAGTFLDTLGIALGFVREPSEVERNRMFFVAGDRDLPRSYLRDPFSIENEVGGSLTRINALAPRSRPAGLISWTGDARPFEAVIHAAREAGLRDIGGGGINVSPVSPSITDVPPVARQAGNEMQAYTRGISGGEIVSDRPDSPAAATARDLTEAPVRLTALGLHYHMSAATSLASLNLLRSHLDWARTAPLAPITASRYAAIADGFRTVRIESLGDNRWQIFDRDGLQTVRFDDAKGIEVDIAASAGVVGSRLVQGSLYVALDEAVAEPFVAIQTSDRQAGAAFSDGLQTAQLDEARWLVRDVRRGACSLGFSSEGFGKAVFAWRDVGPGEFKLEVRSGPTLVHSQIISAGSDGTLRFALPADRTGRLEFVLSCESGSLEEPS